MIKFENTRDLRAEKVEEMTKAVSMAFMDIEAKLDALTTFQGLTVRDMGGGVYEVVKQTEHPAGDYLHPIPWEAGMEVTEGLWYYLDDPDLPAECVQGGTCETYGAPWLDVIAV